MNAGLLDAKSAPATLETREDGREVLVRDKMITYLTDICDSIDETLAQLPALIKKYSLSEYANEAIYRAMLVDGFGAVQEAVIERTRAKLRQSGLFPKLVEKLAVENVECIPPEFRKELEEVIRGLKDLNAELDVQLPEDFGTLQYISGKLLIPGFYRDEITARYTLSISGKERDTVKKIRRAAAILADLKDRGLQIADAMRIPPSGGSPILVPGLITRMAAGSEYTDAELLGLVKGIELRH